MIWGLVVLAIGAAVAWRIFLSPARLRALAESNLAGMIEGRISVAEAQFALEHGIVVNICAWVPIILLACVGILKRKREIALLLLLLSPVAYFTLLHMVFVGSVRYRTPIKPFVILLAASGAEAIRVWWSRCACRRET